MSQAKLIKESEYFFAWFVFWVCSSLAGATAGFLAGAVAGFLLTLLGVDKQWITMGAGAAAGFIVGIPISYAFFRIFVASIIVKRIIERTSQLTPRGAAKD